MGPQEPELEVPARLQSDTSAPECPGHAQGPPGWRAILPAPRTGRGDAQDPARVPGLHALSPASDATRCGAADRRKKNDLDVLEMPSIPNPFPELCCSPITSVLSAGLFPRANSRKKQPVSGLTENTAHTREAEPISELVLAELLVPVPEECPTSQRHFCLSLSRPRTDNFM
uniref:growth factor receptor-bound protein 10-like n=1 Tax=Myodes glareolus TaxID=447135 RepID=UPI00202131F2|nr:growth factor receptor-bound protein 10-like [Myodes glareolus]